MKGKKLCFQYMLFSIFGFVFSSLSLFLVLLYISSLGCPPPVVTLLC